LVSYSTLYVFEGQRIVLHVPKKETSLSRKRRCVEFPRSVHDVIRETNNDNYESRTKNRTEKCL